MESRQLKINSLNPSLWKWEYLVCSKSKDETRTQTLEIGNYKCIDKHNAVKVRTYSYKEKIKTHCQNKTARLLTHWRYGPRFSADFAEICWVCAWNLTFCFSLHKKRIYSLLTTIKFFLTVLVYLTSRLTTIEQCIERPEGCYYFIPTFFEKDLFIQQCAILVKCLYIYIYDKIFRYKLTYNWVPDNRDLWHSSDNFSKSRDTS
jgi:hypothetical protein